jgi:hypothetical protein
VVIDRSSFSSKKKRVYLVSIIYIYGTYTGGFFSQQLTLELTSTTKYLQNRIVSFVGLFMPMILPHMPMRDLR